MKIDPQPFKENFLDHLSKKEILNVLKSSGKARSASESSVLETFLNDTDQRPFVKSYESLRCSFKEFVEHIENLGSELLFSRESNYYKDGKINPEMEMMLYRIQKGYYIEMELKLLDSNGWSYMQSSDIEDNETYIQTLNFILYTPGKNSSLYSEELEKTIEEIALKTVVEKGAENVTVGMICKSDHFFVKDFYITRDYSLVNNNLHYGDKFEEFHDSLLERLKTEPKGLVLFHGEPGTGKTYYIRNLIKDLSKLGKKIIYFPPNMISHLVSPDIMTFLSSLVMDLSEDGKSCVLLLEDAEPLLVSRKGDGRSEGITNLLNLTDGLLNDMLSMQVIATFNTDLKDIDTALLRPERLIARKEFKKLSKEDANKLAKELNITKEFDKDVSLAEIYSTKKSKEILIHEYSSQEIKKIGFK